jgi:hypothetical protein
MSDNQQLLQPDPALRRLDRLVGTWTTRRSPTCPRPNRLSCHPSPTTFGLRKDQADEPRRGAADTLGKPIPPLDVEVATQ